MERLTKRAAYQKLFAIKSQGEDISEMLRETAKSEEVPYDVIVFINKHLPLPVLETYNHIYRNRRKNPLYKSLVNESATPEEQAISLSSLVTQILIRGKSLTKQESVEHMNTMQLKGILRALEAFSEGDNKTLRETFLSVRDVFKRLF